MSVARVFKNEFSFSSVANVKLDCFNGKVEDTDEYSKRDNRTSYRSFQCFSFSYIWNRKRVTVLLMVFSFPRSATASAFSVHENVALSPSKAVYFFMSLHPSNQKWQKLQHISFIF